jgi:hypothetical protein
MEATRPACWRRRPNARLVYWAAMVAVVDQPSRWLPLGDRHVEGVQDQFGAQVVGHRPADDPAGEAVQHDREVQPAFAGALLGDVGHPQPVWCWWGEVAFDQVGCWGGVWIAAGQPGQPAAMAALEASGPHQPGHPLAAYMHVQSQAELGVHTRAP